MINILGSGMYVPKDVLTNDQLSEMVDTSDEWIVSRTGIKNRYIAKDEQTIDLAYKASLKAIEDSKIDVDEIDLIVVASMTAELKSPGISNLLQERLGINHSVMSFDINAACSGFVYALHVASSLVNTNNFRKALVIGVERMSSVMDYTDRNTCVLFGDGAAGVIIDKSMSSQATFYSSSLADKNLTLYVDEFLKMDGRKVYQFAIEIMPKAILEVMENAKLTFDDIDIIIPHQANYRIIESVAKHLGLPKEKFFVNIEKYANTSAASIPIALHEYRINHGGKGKKALLVGFGAGFTWSAAIIDL